MIQWAVSVFRQNRSDDIMVVVGHRAADLEAALGEEEVRIARNGVDMQGMASSVKIGM